MNRKNFTAILIGLLLLGATLFAGCTNVFTDAAGNPGQRGAAEEAES
jgi:hypothetical protein